ncbi:MAG TPA: CDP-diacylglycerol--glycerol-3-phosphate 3-phosphatidyltransferase [Terriglobales bacterium]|nr:CDP-diacylglycerol--glycerol-3-phosphate 3-phosphatidyltransferase [Terriglobales bacterium]
MKLTQFLYLPNQLTLLRLVFLPLIVLSLLAGHNGWALGLFVAAGVTDFFDGQLARRLHQATTLGEYLDPIADKMLLSTMFLVLSVLHRIPWKFTVVVFGRDISILVVSAVLYVTTSLRDFRPSVFGKANTTSQVLAVFFVLLLPVRGAEWVYIARFLALWATFVFTIVSGVHYAFLGAHRLHAAQQGSRAAG